MPSSAAPCPAATAYHRESHRGTGRQAIPARDGRFESSLNKVGLSQNLNRRAFGEEYAGVAAEYAVNRKDDKAGAKRNRISNSLNTASAILTSPRISELLQSRIEQ